VCVFVCVGGGGSSAEHECGYQGCNYTCVKAAHHKVHHLLLTVHQQVLCVRGAGFCVRGGGDDSILLRF
jgi:hypothetical protein